MNEELNIKKAIHTVPAILPKSFADLEQKLSIVNGHAAWIQIDAVDGVFAPNKTWPYSGDSEERFTKIVNQEEGLPSWEDVSFEIDLMVTKPDFEADKWIAAGAERVVVHIKSIEPDQFEILAKNIKEKGVALVLGVAFDVSVETVRVYATLAEEFGGIDGIQCMGIQKVGFQQQSLDSAIFQKLKDMKAAFPGMPLIVDGGVTLDNAENLANAGATRLVCGSSIFNADSPLDAIKHIEKFF